MPSITSLILLAALLSVPALVLIAWVGLLFHRVLRLPADRQQHGVTVLKQLTTLVREGARSKNTNGQLAQRRPRRTKSPQNEGRP